MPETYTYEKITIDKDGNQTSSIGIAEKPQTAWPVNEARVFTVGIDLAGLGGGGSVSPESGRQD
jgi:hypothetical protein